MNNVFLMLLMACYGICASVAFSAEVTSVDVASEEVATSEATVVDEVKGKKNAIKSGLQPGEKTIAFHVQDVTGPRAGKTLCYACAFGKHSVINIQAKKLNDKVLALIKQLDSLVAPAGKIKGDSKHAFVVYLTEDPEAAEKELTAIAKKLELKNIPLTIYDELSGPRPYKLSTDAELTVMMWEDAKVTANHAFSAGGMKKGDVKVVMASAKKHLKGNDANPKQ